MVLRAPNVALFVIAGCLAMVGVLSALPIELPIPGLSPENAAWYIFLGWFLLAGLGLAVGHWPDDSQVAVPAFDADFAGVLIPRKVNRRVSAQ